MSTEDVKLVARRSAALVGYFRLGEKICSTSSLMPCVVACEPPHQKPKM